MYGCWCCQMSKSEYNNSGAQIEMPRLHCVVHYDCCTCLIWWPSPWNCLCCRTPVQALISLSHTRWPSRRRTNPFPCPSPWNSHLLPNSGTSLAANSTSNRYAIEYRVSAGYSCRWPSSSRKNPNMAMWSRHLVFRKRPNKKKSINWCDIKSQHCVIHRRLDGEHSARRYDTLKCRRSCQICYVYKWMRFTVIWFN